jgi:hypothetical protein
MVVFQIMLCDFLFTAEQFSFVLEPGWLTQGYHTWSGSCELDHPQVRQADAA